MSLSKVVNVFNRSKLRSFARFYSIEPPPSISGPKLLKFGVPKYLVDNPKSLSEILKDEKVVDEELEKQYDIGVKHNPFMSSFKSRIENYKTISDKQDDEKLNEVEKIWLREKGPIHKKAIASHYGIFHDLFNGSFFTPFTNLRVGYKFGENLITPIFCGNNIKAMDAQAEPLIKYECNSNEFYSIQLTNPDGNLFDNDSECLHWLITNIPGCDIEKGNVLCEYLPPLPPRGTGFHRMVFILYRHNKQIDFNEKHIKKNDLLTRTFKTSTFFRKYINYLTPIGLSFYQTEYDDSVRNNFHNVLDMAEPSYEYDFEPFYIRPLELYPRKQPFDKYYDRYRDKKDIGEEVLKIKSKITSPFKSFEPEFLYPESHEYHKTKKGKYYKPSWLVKKESKIHRRRGQFKILP